MYMSIDYHDLAAVENVLEGRTPNKGTYYQYGRKRATLIAITILAAANDPATLTRKGVYRILLAHLVLEEENSSMPYATIGDSLVACSRELGQHITDGGNHLELTPDTMLLRLLEDKPEYRERAVALYNQALEEVTEYYRHRRKRGHRSSPNEARQEALGRLDTRYGIRLKPRLRALTEAEVRDLAASMIAIADQYPD
jgi:hypothetical protein